MAEVKQRVQLLRSFDGTPTKEQLLDGEVALKLDDRDPTLFFKTKNSQGADVGIAQIKQGAQADWQATSGLSSIKNKPVVVTEILDAVPYTTGQRMGIQVTKNTHGVSSNSIIDIGFGVPEEDDFYTDKPFGNIPANTPVSELRKRSLAEIFDLALFATIDPTLTQPSISFSWNGGSVQVGGATKPFSSVSSSYNLGKVTFSKLNGQGAVLKNQTYASGAQAKVTYSNNGVDTELNSTNWATAIKQTVTEFGSNTQGTIKYTVIFAPGDKLPVNNKGEEIDKTQYPYYGRTYNSSTSQWIQKPDSQRLMSKTITVTMTGTLPWYTNHANIATFAEAGQVSSWSGALPQKKFAAETDSHRESVQVGKALSKIEFYDEVTRSWVDDKISTNWRVSDITKTIGGKTWQYKQYTHDTPTALKRGAIELRFTF